MKPLSEDIADPHLYRLYWKLCLSDILFHLGYEATKENKLMLHEFHKRVLGYKTTSKRSQEAVSAFIRDVTIFWAERGIFVRTSGRQPLWIEKMGLSDIYKGKMIWDLL